MAMGVSEKPGIQIDGNLPNKSGSFKRALSTDMNIGLKNPFHYVDNINIADGSYDARTALAAADTDGSIFLPPGTYAVASNLTFTNKPVFAPGAKLKAAVGVSLRFNNGYLAEDTQQVFDVTANPAQTILFNQPMVTPYHFGAIGNGSTDDSAAFRHAIGAIFDINSVYKSTPLIIPAGDFLISENNVFANYVTDISTRFGITIKGYGWQSNIIFKPTGSTDKYLYDITVATGNNGNQWLFANFQDLTFTIDNSLLTSGGLAHFAKTEGLLGFPMQGWKHNNVQWVFTADSGDVMNIGGSINGSEMLWQDCRVIGPRTFLKSSNTQAVNLRVNNTELEEVTGHCFEFTANTSILIESSSYIANQSVRTIDSTHKFWVASTAYSTSDTIYYDGRTYTVSTGGTTGTAGPTHATGSTTNGTATLDYVSDESHYFVNVVVGVGGHTGSIISKDVRAELRSDAAKILRISGNSADMGGTIVFDQCTFGGNSIGGERNSINIRDGGRTVYEFSKCDFLLSNLYWSGTGVAGFWTSSIAPVMKIKECRNLSANFYKSDASTSTLGQTEFSGNDGYPDRFTSVHAAVGPNFACRPKSTIQGHINPYWPWSTGGPTGLVIATLPTNSLVTGALLRRRYTGGSGTPLQFEIQDGLGNPILTVPEGTQLSLHEASDFTLMHFIAAGAESIYLKTINGKDGDSPVLYEIGDFLLLEYL